MRLKIGIDARLLRTSRGIGTYLRHLLDEMLALRPAADFVLYTDRRGILAIDKYLSTYDNVMCRCIRLPAYPLWEQVLLPLFAWHDGVDVLHCPANAGPVVRHKDAALVTTIHDVMYLLPASKMPRSPSMYQRLGRAYLRAVVPRTIRKATKVITISRHSLEDIYEHVPIQPSQPHVIYEAAGSHCRRMAPGQAEPLLSKLGVTGRFIFALGAIDPRKNTQIIIESFASLSRAHPDVKLIISGLDDRCQALYQRAAAEVDVGDKVLLLGFVSLEELVALYNMAELFVYPSMYEGFGLPILEAMACGVPVLASNSASIPEIAGEAALLVDPADASALTAAMRALLADPTARARLRAQGFERVRQFSWRKMAIETYAVYEEAARDWKVLGNPRQPL